MSSRTSFINPYTFIPLMAGGPVIQELDDSHHTHAWFEPGTFTGRIHCRLHFITPFVIAGKQTEGSPGSILAYKAPGAEAVTIPGSRIRGYLFNLMRALNSSPIQQIEDKRVVLEREEYLDGQAHRKGFIIKRNGAWYIQEVNKEFLVMSERRHEDTQGLILGNPLYEPKTIEGTDIPTYGSEGVKGSITWSHPNYPGVPGAMHKRYLCANGTETKGKEWVKFECWSGQDGENRIPDLNQREKAHLNRWHIVDLSDLGDEYELPKIVRDKYLATVNEMSRLMRERKRDELEHLAAPVSSASKLKEGTFVYFEGVQQKGRNVVRSFGRQYHYLWHSGAVAEKKDNANRKLLHPERCPVIRLAGKASSGATESGMKTRIFVEMATHSPGQKILIDPFDLRILASHPPKADEFYLRNGRYADANSEIRGRKFYWHDPNWKYPSWDNQDLEGDYAFQNPMPREPKLEKQWSRAEVVVAIPGRPATFDFVIRAINLSEGELNILLTAIVGFSPIITLEGELGQEDPNKWLHKIGYARPYLGSAFMTVKAVEELDVTVNDIKTVHNAGVLQSKRQALNEWQQRELSKEKCSHIGPLKRVLSFEGAYEGIPQEQRQDVRILYPVAPAKAGRPLNWPAKLKDQPKGYAWFRRNKDNRNHSLPEPEPGQSVALPVSPEDSVPFAGPPNKPGFGALGAAFAKAQKAPSKEHSPGGKKS